MVFVFAFRCMHCWFVAACVGRLLGFDMGCV